NVRVYGIDQWAKLFTDRQLVAATEHVRAFRELVGEVREKELDKGLADSIVTCLALAVSNGLQYQCNTATFLSDHVVAAFIQGQSLGMKMDFVETNPVVSDLVGGFDYALSKTLSGVE